MKRLTVILLLLSVINSLAISASPNSEQAVNLAEAIWKSPPHSIDLTYYVTAKDNTKTEQQLRKIYEDTFDKLHGPKENLNIYMLEQREKTVRNNVERCLKEQQAGRKVKYRIRFDGDRQCIDKVYGSPERTVLKGTAQEEHIPEKKLGPDTPFETTVIEVTGPNNTSERYEYFYEGKTATRKTIKSRPKLENSEIMRFTTMPKGIASLLQMKLGDSEDGSFGGPYDANQTKLEQLCSGTLNGINVKILPDKDKHDSKDKIEINIYNDNGVQFLDSTMICAKDDYSLIYYYEIRTPATKAPVITETRDNFDSQGFPHVVTEIRYGNNGEIRSAEDYQIEKVIVNASIPKTVFEFNPPEDYDIIDEITGKNDVAEKAKGRSEASEMLKNLNEPSDIPALTKLLQHEYWKIRLLALKKLEALMLENEPNELSDIVTPLLNDENVFVRSEAGKILKRTE